MKKKNKYITVLDFENGKVYQYKIPAFNDHNKYEEYIIEKGHRLSNCEWMIHDSYEIITN